MTYDVEEKINLIAQWIKDHDRIVIFTGAGVSTESGISDFRSPGGIWERFDPNEFLFDKFLASEKVREKYWQFHTEIYYTILKAQAEPRSPGLCGVRPDGKVRLCDHPKY